MIVMKIDVDEAIARRRQHIAIVEVIGAFVEIFDIGSDALSCPNGWS